MAENENHDEEITELKALQAQQRVIFDSVPAMIWFKDDKNRVLRINQVAAQAIGRKVEEVEGHQTSEFYPEEAEKYLVDDQEVIRTGHAKLGIIEQVQMATGEKHWIRTDKVPYRDARGKIAGVIVFAVDIDERIQAEEKLRRLSEVLDRSNRDLEQFASILSHDLSEPIRMVSAYLRLLSAQYADKLDDRGREFIAFANDGAARMKELIQAVFAYSRASQPQGSLEPVETSTALKAALDDLRILVRDSGATIEIDEKLPRVMGNFAELCQIFQNLISNAIKFRSTAPPRLRIWAVAEEERWVFHVSDNGIGVPGESTERIFALFQRVHDREKYPGRGIGLAICKRIVERAGGHIWAKPRPEGGSVFSFSLTR